MTDSTRGESTHHHDSIFAHHQKYSNNGLVRPIALICFFFPPCVCLCTSGTSPLICCTKKSNHSPIKKRANGISKSQHHFSFVYITKKKSPFFWDRRVKSQKMKNLLFFIPPPLFLFTRTRRTDLFLRLAGALVQDFFLLLLASTSKCRKKVVLVVAIVASAYICLVKCTQHLTQQTDDVRKGTERSHLLFRVLVSFPVLSLSPPLPLLY